MSRKLVGMVVLPVMVCAGVVMGSGAASAASCKVTSGASIYSAPGDVVPTGSVSAGDSWWEDSTTLEFGQTWSNGHNPYGPGSGWVVRSALSCW